MTDKEYLTAVCERLRRAGENCATADSSKSKRLLDAARETEKIIKTL